MTTSYKRPFIEPAGSRQNPLPDDDPEVRTARITLRPLREQDRAEFTALLDECREALREFFPLHREGETNDDVFDRQAAFARGARATGRAWRRLICVKDAIVGAVNFNDITDAPVRAAEVNIWLAPRFQRRGLGREALEAAVDHAFRPAPDGLGLDRVWAYIAPDNIACLRLFYGRGFARDRRAPAVQLNLAGRWKTHHAYERLRTGG